MRKLFLILFTYFTLLSLQVIIVKANENEKIPVTNYGEDYLDYLKQVIKVEDGYLAVGSTDLYEGNRDIVYEERQSSIIVKLDHDLNILWQKTYDDFSMITGITQLKDQNILIVGNFNGKTVILKINTHGEVIFKKEEKWNVSDSFFARYFGVSATEDHGFVVVGYIKDESLGKVDFIKYNESGMVEWTSTFDQSPYNARFVDIVTVKEGFVASGVADKCILKSDGMNYCESVNLVVRLDQSGEMIWVKEIKHSINNLIQSKDGNIILIGSESRINERLSGYFRIKKAKTSEVYASISKIDLITGNTTWNRVFGGNVDEEFQFTSVTEDEQGQIIAVGLKTRNNRYRADFRKSFDVDYVIDSLRDFLSEGVISESFMVKYDASGKLNWQSMIDAAGVLSVIADGKDYITVGFNRVSPVYQSWLSHFDAFYSQVDEEQVPKLKIDLYDEEAIERQNTWIVIRCGFIYSVVFLIILKLILLCNVIKILYIPKEQFYSLLHYLEKENGFRVFKDNTGYYNVVEDHRLLFMISPKKSLRIIKGYTYRSKQIIKKGLYNSYKREL